MSGEDMELKAKCKNELKSAKARFQAAQRRAIYKYELKNMKELSESAELNENFWPMINKNHKGSVSPIRTDDGTLLVKPDDIRKEWSAYYNDLFSEKHNPEWDASFKEYIDSEINNTDYTERVHLDRGAITLTEIDEQIRTLKKKKAPGWDKLTAEHIIYCGEYSRKVITWIINYVIHTERIPGYMKKGIMVSIPKSGKDKSIKSNNRGLTLMPIMYKILEKVLIKRESLWLHNPNVIDCIQSAGQEKCSCLHSSFLAQEAIYGMLNKSESVYGTGLDTSKAFDTVWINGLLWKLKEKGLNKKTWRLIRSGYTDFQCSVSVGGEIGVYFTLQRGVHQGAPFSMWLYMVFINDLIQELKACGVGIAINCHNISSPAHADDVFCLCIYKMGMNMMLDRALKYSCKWRYSYNMDKMIALLYGIDTMPHVDIKIGNVCVKTEPAFKHVGNTLCTTRRDQKHAIETRICAARQVVLAARGIGSKRVPVPPLVLSRIYWTVAIPKLLYGLDVTPLHESDIESLEKAHRTNARTIQGLPAATANPSVLAPLGWMSIGSLLAMYQIMFMLRVLCSPINTVYKSLMISRLCEIINTDENVRYKHVTPVMSMLQYIKQFHVLYNKLCRCIVDSDFGSIGQWKILVKRAVWDSEHAKWRNSCLLYRGLSDYTDIICKIEPFVWLKVLQSQPHLFVKVSFVMAIICGSQPPNLFCNAGNIMCHLCSSREKDCPVHVIFECPAISDVSSPLLQIVIDKMPREMVVQFGSFNNRTKLNFLLSGMRAPYTSERTDLYRSVLELVYGAFKERHALYTAL